jgi:hypothetical protein
MTRSISTRIVRTLAAATASALITWTGLSVIALYALPSQPTVASSRLAAAPTAGATQAR